jgi:hypothetical protein
MAPPAEDCRLSRILAAPDFAGQVPVEFSVAGYTQAYLWDDPGRFYGRLVTADAGALANALNYMGHFRSRPIWGFDICLVHRDDGALAAELESGVAVNAVAPLA